MPAPTSFKAQRTLLRNIILSAKSQLTLAETMADADLTYRSRPETTGFCNLGPEKESDYKYAGKGSSFATESRLIDTQSSGDITTRLDDFLAGWAFAFVMGKEVFTAGVDPAPNTHVFTWLDTCDPAKVTNIYVEDGTGLKRKFQDMALSKLVLSGTDKGSITAKMSLMGTGRYADGAMVTLPALPTAQYLYGSDGIVSVGPAGAPVSMFPRVISWEATFDHAIELFRACGGGIYAVFPRYGNPVNSLKLVIAADDTKDVQDWMNNQTPLEVSIAVTSGAASLTIDYPYVILPKSDLSEQDKYVAYTVDLDQNSILKNGASESCSVTVVNTQTEYLIGA